MMKVFIGVLLLGGSLLLQSCHSVGFADRAALAGPEMQFGGDVASGQGLSMISQVEPGRLGGAGNAGGGCSSCH